MAFCSRQGAASDVFTDRFVRPIVLDMCVQFRDLSLDRSRETPTEAVVGGIFDRFSLFRAEVDNDVMSGVAVR